MLQMEKERRARERLRELKQRANHLGLRNDEIKAILNLDRAQNNRKFIRILKAKLLLRKLLAFTVSSKSSPPVKYAIAVLVVALGYYMIVPENFSLASSIREKLDERCIITLPPYLSEVVRPRVPCEICKDLDHVPVEYNISKADFTNIYAYTGVPVIIKGAISDWGALHNFSYHYFKHLYKESPDSLTHVYDYCQFFQYQTEFETLDEVFDMSDDRAALQNGTRPWYIGWSNCDAAVNKVGLQLRTQYARPYFLPDHSSNLDTDWIFMGGPGFGAGMHIDYVERPSWQAQVSGSKTWMLDPTPECWHACKRLEVTVEKGDIFVLDTNIWYHSTLVNPGNISITIGAEYD